MAGLADLAACSAQCTRCSDRGSDGSPHHATGDRRTEPSAPPVDQLRQPLQLLSRNDQQYLAEDARRVVQQLRRRGIDTFAFGISNGPFSQLDRIFGERRALRVPRIEVLPQRLVQLSRELKK